MNNSFSYTFTFPSDVENYHTLCDLYFGGITGAAWLDSRQPNPGQTIIFSICGLSVIINACIREFLISDAYCHNVYKVFRNYIMKLTCNAQLCTTDHITWVP
jgi:hypothetical protein